MKQNIKEYWKNFCQIHNLDANTSVDAFAFGYTDQEADHLARLVNQGIKTATTSIYEDDEHLPKVGEYSIILDSRDNPVCVIQEKSVTVIPYDQISAEYAYLEGEGDRSYEYWRSVHDDFFEREFREQLNQDFDSKTLMVCEVFAKVN